MEDLGTQEGLLNLGKQLADNFNGVEGDQLNEWMSCYIAEKITTIESARGKARLSAQKECFEAILTLWSHQSHFPRGTRPFESFESVFRALAHIDPDKNSHSFFRNENDQQQVPKEIESYIHFITDLDAATRVLISFFVKEAVAASVDESTIQWLDAIKCVDKSDEAQIILRFMSELDGADKAQSKTEKKIEVLATQLEYLERFDRLSKYARSSLEMQLEGLK